MGRGRVLMDRTLLTYDAAEARNKLSHFTVQGFDLNGVVQAGAGDGEEMHSFINMGIKNLIAFEPLTKAYEQLVESVGQQVICEQIGLHNQNDSADLYVTIGDGKGSSLFETVWDHPEVLRNWNQGQAAVEGTETIELMRFDTYAKLNPQIDWSQYDTLQLDTQGNEMEILEGMGEYLQNFKYLCIELSITPVYKGETPGREVANWLEERGFILDSPIYEHNDSFFIRKDIKSTSDQTYRGRC